jgi:hypothetical protein
MKPFVVALLIVAASSGCAPNRATIPSGMASLWGLAVEDHGGCAANVTVTVIAGQAVGTTVAQETPCDTWGWYGGFWIKGLNANEPLTLRVSAPGFVTREVTTYPNLVPGGSSASYLVVMERVPVPGAPRSGR